MAKLAARLCLLVLLLLACMAATSPHAKAGATPVLVVHGCCGGTVADTSDVAAALTSQGRTVYNLAIPSAQDPVQNAWYIWGFVQFYQLGQVDIVGYSMGGLSARYYIKNLGGNVRTLVELDSPNAGNWFVCLMDANLCTNSPFITALNAGDQTPGPTFYVEIVSNFTEVLSGGVCYLQTTGDHVTLPHRADVIAWTELALAGVCPGQMR